MDARRKLKEQRHATKNNQLPIIFRKKTCILKSVVQGTQKWHWNFSWPSGFYVMDQNSQNNVLINNTRTVWRT